VTRRTILLSVDGSLLVEIDSPERAYAAYRTGRDEGPLAIPPGAGELDFTGLNGRGPYFFRPAVVEVLRDLAHAGVDIVWNTRWLTSPEVLGELAHVLGLDEAVRFPTAAELPSPAVNVRIDHGPNVFWEHWKIQALIQRVRDLPEGAQLVIIDAHMDYSSRRLADGVARRSRREDARVGGIMTIDRWGLDERGIAALRSWGGGAGLPAI